MNGNKTRALENNYQLDCYTALHFKSYTPILGCSCVVAQTAILLYISNHIHQYWAVLVWWHRLLYCFTFQIIYTNTGLFLCGCTDCYTALHFKSYTPILGCSCVVAPTAILLYISNHIHQYWAVLVWLHRLLYCFTFQIIYTNTGLFLCGCTDCYTALHFKSYTPILGCSCVVAQTAILLYISNHIHQYWAVLVWLHRLLYCFTFQIIYTNTGLFLCGCTDCYTALHFKSYTPILGCSCVVAQTAILLYISNHIHQYWAVLVWLHRLLYCFTFQIIYTNTGLFLCGGTDCYTALHFKSYTPILGCSCVVAPTAILLYISNHIHQYWAVLVWLHRLLYCFTFQIIYTNTGLFLCGCTDCYTALHFKSYTPILGCSCVVAQTAILLYISNHIHQYWAVLVWLHRLLYCFTFQIIYTNTGLFLCGCTDCYTALHFKSYTPILGCSCVVAQTAILLYISNHIHQYWAVLVWLHRLLYCFTFQIIYTNTGLFLCGGTDCYTALHFKSYTPILGCSCVVAPTAILLYISNHIHQYWAVLVWLHLLLYCFTFQIIYTNTGLFLCGCTDCYTALHFKSYTPILGCSCVVAQNAILLYISNHIHQYWAVLVWLHRMLYCFTFQIIYTNTGLFLCGGTDCYTAFHFKSYTPILGCSCVVAPTAILLYISKHIHQYWAVLVWLHRLLYCFTFQNIYTNTGLFLCGCTDCYTALHFKSYTPILGCSCVVAPTAILLYISNHIHQYGAVLVWLHRLLYCFTFQNIYTNTGLFLCGCNDCYTALHFKTYTPILGCSCVLAQTLRDFKTCTPLEYMISNGKGSQLVVVYMGTDMFPYIFNTSNL